MKKNKTRHNAGFTLMEMMVSMSLLSIFSIFMVNLVMVTQQAWTIEYTAAPVRTEAKKTLEVIAKELREADPSAAGGVVIGTNGGNSSSQSITFSVPNQVSQTSIQSWRVIQFNHDTTQNLVNRVAGGTTTVVGRNINSLQFSVASNVVTTTIGASKATPDGRTLQATLSSQVRLRN